MKRAVIITGPGFQDEEFVYPYYRMQEAGYHLDVATKDKTVVIGKFGVAAKPTKSAQELKSSDYDVVIIPGGWEAPERVRLIPEVLVFVREMYEQGKIVGAICHGPCVLISAGILKGKRATGFEGIADDIKNSGAIYLDAPVVVDGNIVTSPHYRNNGDFLREVLKAAEQADAPKPSPIDFHKNVVNKPWGYEYLMYDNGKVALWFLHIRKGEETSLHCHSRKKTGLILLSGEAKVSFLNDGQTIQGLSKLMIRQGLFHSTRAASEDGVYIIEVETPNDKPDLVRLLDKYGREGKPYGAEGIVRPVDADCVLVHGKMEPKKLQGCTLRVETFADTHGFKNRPAGQALVVLEGGLVSRKGIPVLAEGDIVWSHNLDRLTEICTAPRGATLFVIEKDT